MGANVNFITRKQQNQKDEPVMMQLGIQLFLFNWEVKLHENDWLKNTVTSLTTGSKSVNSRLISLPPKNECQWAPPSGSNKQNEKWFLSSKNLHLPEKKSQGVSRSVCMSPLTRGPTKAKPTILHCHTMHAFNKSLANKCDTHWILGLKVLSNSKVSKPGFITQSELSKDW